MIKILAFFLTFTIFNMIIETPLVKYIPQPIQQIFILEEESYEYPYTLTVAVPEDNFSWENPEVMVNVQNLSFDEINKALSTIEGLEEINDYEYLYYIYDQELRIELVSSTVESIQYIDFSVYSEQIPYFTQIYDIASEVAKNINGAKILDYQNELFVTDQNLNEVENSAEEWFLFE